MWCDTPYALLILFCVAIPIECNYYYESIKCKSSIKIPLDNELYVAGTLFFGMYPNETCVFSVTVNNTVSSVNEELAIFLNVRELDLLVGDLVHIFDGLNLVKTLPGGPQNGTARPSSFATFLSSFSRKPTLRFQFVKTSSGEGHEFLDHLTLDYTLIYRLPHVNENRTYCPSLDGYILNDRFHDPGIRVHCPPTYKATLMLNPVEPAEPGWPYRWTTSTAATSARTTLSTSRRSPGTPTLSMNRPPDDNDISITGPVVGGALAGLFLVALVVGGVCWFVRRRSSTRWTRFEDGAGLIDDAQAHDTALPT